MSQMTRRGFAAVTAASYARVMGANDRIGIAVIGAGGRANEHLRHYVRWKDLNISVTGVCDVWRVNKERYAAAAEKSFGVKPRTASNYEEALNWKEADAVLITTPDFAHPIILKAAVEAGKDAYVEKPFATDFPSAKAAFQAVKQSKQIVQVGSQRRSDPLYAAAAKAAREGAVGQITRVEIAVDFQQPRWRRPDEKVLAEDVDWKSFQMGRITQGFNARLLREWQLFQDTTNGLPGLWMSHFIDLVPWFTGDPYPAAVSSEGGVFLWKDGRQTSDVFYTLLKYPKDFVTTWSMTLTNSAGSRNHWYGTLGTLDCEKWHYSGEGSVRPDRVKEVTKLVPAEPPAGDSTVTHVRNWIECMRSRQQPNAPVEAGFSHAVAGVMSSEALRLGRRMRFDPAKLEML
jgi:predicted dehydrogenase